MRKNKPRFLSLYVLLICCSCNVASSHDEFAFAPNALLFGQKSKTIVVGIKRHGAVYSYRERHGSATKAMENSYYIESYDAADMRPIAKKEIATNAGGKRTPPQVIGKEGERIWIFTDQLTAYDCLTLAQVVNRKTLELKNPGLKNILLNEGKYYQWDDKNKTINITAADGTRWRLNTLNLAAAPYEDSSGNKTAAKKRNRREALWRTGSEKAFKSNQDTLADTFYGLYSTEELPVYAGAFRNDAAGSPDAVRKLWAASFHHNKNKIAIDTDSLKSISGRKFINGFFLVNRNTLGVFHCTSPSGFIIGYKTAVGKNGLVNLARITTDGREIWDIETGIREIKGLDFTDHYALIQAADENGHLINKMYSIRLADGKMSEAGL